MFTVLLKIYLWGSSERSKPSNGNSRVYKAVNANRRVGLLSGFQRRLLSHSHKTFQFTALPFGLSMAPMEFTIVIKEVKVMAQNQHIQIHQYLDEWLIQAKDKKTFPSVPSDSMPGPGLDCKLVKGSHGCRVVTLSPPKSEIGVQFLALPQVGKLVVTCRWSAVYSTEP